MSISDEIIKVLDALAEKLGLAIDWTSSNVIPYLEQLCDKYVNYEIATSVIWLIFGIIFLFVTKWEIKQSKRCFNNFDEIGYDWDVAGILVAVCAVITLIIGIIVIMCQLFDIVTCFTFPEKIIFDELKLLYTSMNGGI